MKHSHLIFQDKIEKIKENVKFSKQMEDKKESCKYCDGTVNFDVDTGDAMSRGNVYNIAARISHCTDEHEVKGFRFKDEWEAQKIEMPLTDYDGYGYKYKYDVQTTKDGLFLFELKYHKYDDVLCGGYTQIYPERGSIPLYNDVPKQD